jgi:lysophospholipase L1-like esterase
MANNQHRFRRSLVLVLVGLAFSATQADEPKKNPHARWEATIKKFEERDQTAPPKKGGVLFVGSSSIRMWKLDKSFPELGAINRGFGGSEIADSIHFADRIVFNHEPRSIVMYAGDNDISRGKTPKQVVSDFKRFVKLVQDKSPQSRIAFIAIKPSIRRWALARKMSEANVAIQKLCEDTKNVDYVDIWKPMLGKDGKPRPSLFIKDGLHLSEEGYELWTSIVKPYVVRSKNK